MACHQQIDADPDPIPDPGCHFDADLFADPNFYLMQMRIQVNKMMRFWRIRIHNTASSKNNSVYRKSQ